MSSIGNMPFQEARARVRNWIDSLPQPVRELVADSRDVSPGDVFLALPGERSDGSRFVRDALGRGAVGAIIQDDSGLEPASIPVLRIPSLKESAPWLAADHYRDPSATLGVAAVTGTNGKTSTTHWIAQILDQCKHPCAVLGTLGFAIDGKRHQDAIVLTTPDAVSLQRLCRKALNEGARALALEASSIGIAQGRLTAMHLEVAVFTNLTQDHLDFHGSMAAYAQAKRNLFDWPGLRVAVLNLDDEHGLRWMRELAQRQATPGAPMLLGYQVDPDVVTDLPCRRILRARSIRSIDGEARGTCFTLHDEGPDGTGESHTVFVPLLGAFNVANVLAAIAACVGLGARLSDAVLALPRLQAPPGRMQAVDIGNGVDAKALPLVVVDYAHTPDAIAKAIETLRPIARARSGRLCIVFGAGGDRDASKRPLMGCAAAAADRIIVTSDNPRSEDPEKIIAHICAGLGHHSGVEKESDRHRAITRAVNAAAVADVILIAGKGHETTQEIHGARLPFSDLEHARSALRARWAGAPSC